MQHQKHLTKNTIASALLTNQNFNIPDSIQITDQFHCTSLEIGQNLRKSHGAESSFMVTKKAKLYRKQNLMHTDKLQTATQNDRFSTFDRLKNEIKHLQNSQFLSLKSNIKMQQDHEFNEFDSEYCVNKEFMSTKRVSVLQRYKQVLKRKKRGRRMSNFITFDHLGDNKDYPSCFSSVKAISGIEAISNRTELPLKKKETPNIVKKYYRPQSSNIKSVDSFQLNQNEVRGRQLKSTQSNRKDKENYIIMCL